MASKSCVNKRISWILFFLCLSFIDTWLFVCDKMSWDSRRKFQFYQSSRTSHNLSFVGNKAERKSKAKVVSGAWNNVTKTPHKHVRNMENVVKNFWVDPSTFDLSEEFRLEKYERNWRRSKQIEGKLWLLAWKRMKRGEKVELFFSLHFNVNCASSSSASFNFL